MNIAIFGASGATGRLLTARCLEAGHQVTALVRTPAAFAYRDRVRVIQGSAFDPAPVRQTVGGADAVFSALGTRTPFRNANVLPRAVPLIIDAMKQTGVRRIIALGSAGALDADAALRRQSTLRRWMIRNFFMTLLKWPVAEQKAQYAALSASGLDWTMALPPMLTNTPAKGSYRIDGEALPPNASRISREDVAAFMMQQLDNPQWVRKGVYIAY